MCDIKNKNLYNRTGSVIMPFGIALAILVVKIIIEGLQKVDADCYVRQFKKNNQ